VYGRALCASSPAKRYMCVCMCTHIGGRYRRVSGMCRGTWPAWELRAPLIAASASTRRCAASSRSRSVYAAPTACETPLGIRRGACKSPWSQQPSMHAGRSSAKKLTLSFFAGPIIALDGVAYHGLHHFARPQRSRRALVHNKPRSGGGLLLVVRVSS